MKHLPAVFLGVLLYALLCLLIALVRTLFAGPKKRQATFWKTFWGFFTEVLDPFRWF